MGRSVETEPQPIKLARETLLRATLAIEETLEKNYIPPNGKGDFVIEYNGVQYQNGKCADFVFLGYLSPTSTFPEYLTEKSHIVNIREMKFPESINEGGRREFLNTWEEIFKKDGFNVFVVIPSSKEQVSFLEKNGYRIPKKEKRKIFPHHLVKEIDLD